MYILSLLCTFFLLNISFSFWLIPRHSMFILQGIDKLLSPSTLETPIPQKLSLFSFPCYLWNLDFFPLAPSSSVTPFPFGPDEMACLSSPLATWSSRCHNPEFNEALTDGTTFRHFIVIETLNTLRLFAILSSPSCVEIHKSAGCHTLRRSRRCSPHSTLNTPDQPTSLVSGPVWLAPRRNGFRIPVHIPLPHTLGVIGGVLRTPNRQCIPLQNHRPGPTPLSIHMPVSVSPRRR